MKHTAAEDEATLERLAKRLLSTPHKPRDASKVAKSKPKLSKSPMAPKASKGKLA